MIEVKWAHFRDSLIKKEDVLVQQLWQPLQARSPSPPVSQCPKESLFPLQIGKKTPIFQIFQNMLKLFLFWTSAKVLYLILKYFNYIYLILLILIFFCSILNRLKKIILKSKILINDN
jgi:hypothetical protein